MLITKALCWRLELDKMAARYAKIMGEFPEDVNGSRNLHFAPKPLFNLRFCAPIRRPSYTKVQRAPVAKCGAGLAASATAANFVTHYNSIFS